MNLLKPTKILQSLIDLFRFKVMQYGVAVRNARLDAIETVLGTTPDLELWSGSMPANCAAAATGTKVATGALPSDWMANAASGVKAKSGAWTLTGAAAGNAGYFRMVATGAGAVGIQGTVTATGGGGDMTVDNVSVAVSQVITVTGFTLTGGQA